MNEQFKVKISTPLGVRMFGQEILGDLKKTGDKVDDQRFDFKEKIDGKVNFTGPDFQFFYTIENSNRRCEKCLFTIYELCGGVWAIRDNCYLSMRDGDWDVDKCQVSFKIVADDRYKRYDEDKEKEYNLFEICQYRAVATYTRAPVGPLPGFTDAMDNGMYLLEIILQLYQRIQPFGTVKSQFFQWNYGGLATYCGKGLLLFQKSDIIRRNAGGNATILKMSLSKVLKNVCTFYNLRWQIDRFGALLIDPYPVLQYTAGANDFTFGDRAQQVAGMRKYNYETDKYFRREVFNNPESRNRDFVGLPIEYDNACTAALPVTSESKIDVDWCTDVEYLCNLDPNNDNDLAGAVLMETSARDITDQTAIIADTAPILDTVRRANNVLSWAILHDRYYKNFGRLFFVGNMNGQQTTFTNIIKTRKQGDLQVKLCCNDNFQPLAPTLTALGMGDVSKYSFQYDKYTLKLDVLFEPTTTLVLDIPIANEDVYYTTLNNSFNSSVTSGGLSLMDNDYRPHACTVPPEIKQTKFDGTVQLFANGSFIYSPPNGFIGLDEFDYTIIDSVTGYSSSALCKIGVRPPAIYVKPVRVDNQGSVTPGGCVPDQNTTYAYYFLDAAGTVPLLITGLGIMLTLSDGNYILAQGTYQQIDSTYTGCGFGTFQPISVVASGQNLYILI